jgi:molecular chaperone GrpE
VTPEALAEQLAQAQAQAAEYLDSWRRSAAEMSNARKRMQREQAEFSATANARLLEKLLPIVDDVDRALGALPADQADGEWANGFRLIQRKLQALLESEGVTTIVAEGQRFDPALHFAVTHEQQAGFAEGDVIGEVARGYRLGDRVLRPAMVRVAKESA